MPQLNPAPWLKISLISWFILLLLLTNLTAHHYVYAPHIIKLNKQTTHWLWPC